MPLSPTSSPVEPIATIALPASNPYPNPVRRGLPPLCWTDEETLALIVCYREKWYSLNRSNLRAAHWDEVAAAVAARSRHIPFSTPKSSVQCRHKMEKLRKRYRTERQRSLALNPRSPPSSPWVFFAKIAQMENPNPNPNWYGEEVDDGRLRFKMPLAVRYPDTNSSWDREWGGGDDVDDVLASNGGNPSPNASWAIPIGIPNPNLKEGVEGKRTREEENDNGEAVNGIREMAKALRMLGDGYLKMEQMKMDMAREMERARMEMEVRRTEMILDTQKRIVDEFVKKVKR